MNTLSGVMDPEVPVLSVIDLGVIRGVRINQAHVEVDIAPTYTGCPAMDVISSSVRGGHYQTGREQGGGKHGFNPTMDDRLDLRRRKKKTFGLRHRSLRKNEGRSKTRTFPESARNCMPQVQVKRHLLRLSFWLDGMQVPLPVQRMSRAV